MKNVIVVTNQKGGCGKTTLAVHLAEALAIHGLKTVLVDSDPQGTAVLWSKMGKLTATVVAVSDEAMPAALTKVSDEYDFVVVDCLPSATAPTTLAALDVAGIALVPCQTSTPDLHATLSLMGVVEGRRPGLPALVVPTCISSTIVSREVLELMETSWMLSRSRLAARTCYREAAAQGTTVHAMSGRAAATAAKEVNDLAFEVITTLNRSAKQ
jgi:chromosome partitioning protein